MSRIGKKPITVPDKVKVSLNDGVVVAKGPLGELQYKVPEAITVVMENNTITFSRGSEERHIRALHGLSRALTANIIEGVSKGFEKNLIIEGVGYRAELRNGRLFMSLGFSHPVLIIPPQGIEFEVPTATTIKIKGIDKQLVGLFAAKIRQIRPPEPYKGKGVRYQNEYIRRKAGKTASK
ncbi:50S ribosomal protein L6 [Candidatus Kapaibacterium sp.]